MNTVLQPTEMIWSTPAAADDNNGGARPATSVVPTSGTATDMPAAQEWLAIATVLLVIQGSLWLFAGLIGLVLGVAMPMTGVSALATIALAIGTFALARGVPRHRHSWVRRCTVVVECVSAFLVIAPTALLSLVIKAPAMWGPVPVMTGIVLPFTVVCLLRRKDVRALFASSSE